jgi:hypothetical protein
MLACIIRLGLVQCFYECALFLFIFLWTPALPPAPETDRGLVFACFMAAVALGSRVVFLCDSTSVDGIVSIRTGGESDEKKPLLCKDRSVDRVELPRGGLDRIALQASQGDATSRHRGGSPATYFNSGDIPSNRSASTWYGTPAERDRNAETSTSMRVKKDRSGASTPRSARSSKADTVKSPVLQPAVVDREEGVDHDSKDMKYKVDALVMLVLYNVAAVAAFL